MDEENEVRLPKCSLDIGGRARGSTSNSERRDPFGISFGVEGVSFPNSAGPNENVQTRQVGDGAQRTPVTDIKAPSRDDFVRPAKPYLSLNLRLLAGALAVLGLGWAGSNIHLFDIAQGKTWLSASASYLSAALATVQEELVDRFEHLSHQSDAVVKNAPAEPRNNTDALDRAADSLNTKLDQMRASSESLTRELSIEVDRLRGSMERRQGELVAKLNQLTERVERLDDRSGGPPVATGPQAFKKVVAMTAPVPPSNQRPAAAGDPPKVAPPPARTEIRREPTVIKQWRVREVLNGMALLEGPTGLVGVSRGEMVPGVGRVESIERRANHWAVATSKGIITSN